MIEFHLVSQVSSNVFFRIFLVVMVILPVRHFHGDYSVVVSEISSVIVAGVEPNLPSRCALHGPRETRCSEGSVSLLVGVVFLLAISLAGMLLFLVGGAYYTGGEKPIGWNCGHRNRGN